MKRIFMFAAIVSVLAIVSGCSLSGQNQPAAGTPVNNNTGNVTVPPQNQPPAAAAEKSITISNFTFNPTPLTISVGTKVTWTNNDPFQHQIKSATFNSSPLDTGSTFSFTFDTPGTYNYSCAIHPYMSGQIIVQ